MLRLTLALLVIWLAVSCATKEEQYANGHPLAPPFTGFHAHPSSGLIELKTTDRIHYEGSIWGDFGPFPFRGTRDGHVIHGAFTVDGRETPLDVEWTPEGIFLIAEGERTGPALMRFKNKKAYEKWFEEQGGYQGEIVPMDSDD